MNFILTTCGFIYSHVGFILATCGFIYSLVGFILVTCRFIYSHVGFIIGICIQEISTDGKRKSIYDKRIYN